MPVLGRANWWQPSWLDHRPPRLYAEGRPERHAPSEPPESSELEPVEPKPLTPVA